MSKHSIDSSRQQIHLLCMVWAQKVIIAEASDGYTLTLKKVDPKVLYMTARPSKNRAFIKAEKFIGTWIQNKNCFESEPPEIALSYTKMQRDDYGVAEAIPIVLFDPKVDIHENTTWIFQLKFLTEAIEPGDYEGACLFIDWLPSFECPTPIKHMLPELLSAS